MKKILAVLAFPVLLATSSCTMSQDSAKTASTPAQKPNTFNVIDKNGDGKISRDEYQAYWIAMFGTFDTDRDGKISENEIKARAEKRVVEIDKNKDGGLTRDEFITLPKPTGKLPEKTRTGVARFAKADINADGSITFEEYYFLMNDRFDSADKNKDGKIDRNEATDMLLEAFHSADINKDGIVTKEEWLTYWTGTPDKAEPAKAK